MRWHWLVLALAFSGCTHTTEFVHECSEPDAVAPVLSRSVKLALASSSGTDERLERRIANEFRASPSVGLVAPRAARAGSDYTVELHVKRRAMSRGTNFVICWPGFLIFTPAWHGLEWPYRVNTVAIVTRSDGTLVGRIERSDLYTAYRTSDSYGVGAGLGWIPFFFTLPAFVTGISASFTPERRALDEEFVMREGEEWARYVAADIMELIARAERSRERAPPAER